MIPPPLMALIDNVSDTARWVAYYRAMETARPDAIFRDLFAERLAGEKGLQIVNTMKLLGLSRFEMKYSNGTMPHDKLMTSIELFGTTVVPMVRERMA